MDSPEYGCDEELNIKKIDDDDLSGTQWKETYKGDSKKWLISDGYSKKSDRGLISTMKATYPYPFEEEGRQHLGERRARIMQNLYDEAANEIMQEREAPPPVEKYCTEYDGNYNGNIKIEKCEIEGEMKKQLYEKYPLYTSNPASFWNFKIEKYQSSNVFFPGLTMSVDLKNPFKRHSGFTKPISEVLDEGTL